eukprot:TRINITY_DN8602_c0_g4_i2.p1 TRINITY_DN8602_c0_g4~~TRINITY_DN8602_c0_g4_i2.p1  ORF type:complete len:1503 (+),score=319.73 TRINITY_DN8602_c0_g4_i2:88-4509(+)
MPPVDLSELRGAAKVTVPVTEIPRSISEIQFDTFSPQEIRKLSSVHVFNKDDYTPGKSVPFGVLDGRMGVCDRSSTCKTCGLKLDGCTGHFGHMELAMPVFHNGFFKIVLNILRCICKSCSKVMIVGELRQKQIVRMRNRRVSSARRQKIQSNLVAMCQKIVECPHCGYVNGKVKKEKGYKIPRLIHERYGDPKNPRAIHVDEFNKLEADMDEALRANGGQLKPYMNKLHDPLTADVCRDLFDAIPPEDREILDMNRHVPASNLIASTMIVPPIPIRPYVDGSATGGAAGTYKDDDLTSNVFSALYSSEMLFDQIVKGEQPGRIWDAWETLQCDYAGLLDADTPGYPPTGTRTRRGLVQRLKGKEGRFRKHLSGKRVDFSGRTVISPDPNLKITELAVPIKVALIMTYPERVHENNRTRLFEAVVNGSETHPGAVYVKKKNGQKRGLAVLSERDRRLLAENLEPGDIVDRHMINGDCVIFNRQPSLHRISMMCHRARILPYRTFRFNECCCAPYNADFDGDEMNIHLPQTEEARAECAILMSTARNMISARHGEPMIAATQDFLTGGYLLTRKNLFFTRTEISQACSMMFEPGVIFELPPPAIMKPRELWTGKQIMSLLVRPNNRTPVHLNFEAKSKFYTSDTHMCPKDGWIHFVDSTLVSGCMDKKIMGGGGKDGLFYQLFLSTGHAYAARCMWRLARLTCRWLMHHGFSIGIEDVTPNKTLWDKTQAVIKKGYEDAAVLIKAFNEGNLVADPGCTAEITVENRLNGVLSTVRSDCGNAAMGVLHWANSPYIMSMCGSKGSPLNIGQMACVLGQQTVTGKRIGNGFIHRSLPHFKRFSREPLHRGFVANSFFTGLQPYEFWFHTMGGREGLVDTAVKTAETGYMQRRLVKSMEDLCVQYDNTVMDSQGILVQLTFGDDGIDPLYTETADFRPVNFDILWNNLSMSRAAASRKEIPLKPDEVLPYLDVLLLQPSSKEFSGKFVKEIKEFWRAKSASLTKINETLQLAVQAVREGPESEGEVDWKNPLSVMKHRAKQREYTELIGASRIQALANDMLLVTKGLMSEMYEECVFKHLKYRCEPGTACGAIGAQSIGEPGTQMTLKTFHFAGVASMSITQGVPRIKEIINAAKTIKTPLITGYLTTDTSRISAEVVKARVQRTTLEDVCLNFDEVYTPIDCYIVVRLDLETIFNKQLDINALSIRGAILSYAASTTRRRLHALHLKDKHIPVDQVSQNAIHIYPYETSREKLQFNIKHILTHLPGVVVAGIATVKRAIISSNHRVVEEEVVSLTGETRVVKNKEEYFTLLIEGSDLLQVCSVPGMDSTRTVCNHVYTIEKVLGIEAARLTIIKEIRGVMGNYGLAIDIRHVMQLADVMTFRGEVLGITRFGMQKMRDSVMMLASFEKTTDILFDAAAHNRKDDKLGVSEKIIMGAPIKIGTGLFKLLQKTEKVRHASKCQPMFKAPKFDTGVRSVV